MLMHKAIGFTSQENNYCYLLTTKCRVYTIIIFKVSLIPRLPDLFNTCFSQHIMLKTAVDKSLGTRLLHQAYVYLELSLCWWDGSTIIGWPRMSVPAAKIVQQNMTQCLTWPCSLAAYILYADMANRQSRQMYIMHSYILQHVYNYLLYNY